jgi:hypothetical protein
MGTVKLTRTIQVKEEAISIQSVVTQYYLSTSNSTPTGGSWSATEPSVPADKFLWIRTITTLTDGTTSTSAPVCVTSVGIKSIVTQYYLSTSNSTTTGGSWVTTKPTVPADKFLWTRTVTTLNDGTVITSAAICVTGVGILSTVTQYYQSSSSSSLTGGSWSTSVPSWRNGWYLWTRTVITYTDGSSVTTSASCVSGGVGPAGAIGAVYQPKGEWNATTTYTKTDKVIQYVIYQGYAYEPLKASVTGGNNPLYDVTNSGGNWKSMGRYDIVATSVLLANFALIAGAVFWDNKLMSQYGLDNSGNESNVYTNYAEDADGNETGSFHPYLILDWIRGKIKGLRAVFENAVIRKSTLTDVVISGSNRTPFFVVQDSFNTTYSDNLIAPTGGSWIAAWSLPWDISQAGRRLTIVTSPTSSGYGEVTAPSGKYFYENGITRTYLKHSREAIELLGFGYSGTFYGWIVLSRNDFNTVGKYGAPLKYLAMGKVTGTATGASITYKTYDGSTMSVTRSNTGIYNVAVNFGTANYMVLLTGVGAVVDSTTSPAKATLVSNVSGYFTVWISDDTSKNDGSFNFLVVSTADW